MSTNECRSIVILGASGNLALTKLLPSLYTLYTSGAMPQNYIITGYARTDMSNDDFRGLVEKNLKGAVEETLLEPGFLKGFLSKIHYCSGGYDSVEDFKLRIVDDATDLYNEKTGENIDKVTIAEALYNYLLDNNPALTIAESPVPDKLLKQFAFLKSKLEDVDSPEEKGSFLKFLDSDLEWQPVKGETSIGSRKADILIEDPKVSGPHCKLTVDSEGHVEIEDLVSENGTYVNGQKVKKQVLMHADLIQLGSGTSLVFYQVD